MKTKKVELPEEVKNKLGQYLLDLVIYPATDDDGNQRLHGLDVEKILSKLAKPHINCLTPIKLKKLTKAQKERAIAKGVEIIKEVKRLNNEERWDWCAGEVFGLENGEEVWREINKLKDKKAKLRYQHGFEDALGKVMTLIKNSYQLCIEGIIFKIDNGYNKALDELREKISKL